MMPGFMKQDECERVDIDPRMKGQTSIELHDTAAGQHERLCIYQHRTFHEFIGDWRKLPTKSPEKLSYRKGARASVVAFYLFASSDGIQEKHGVDDACEFSGSCKSNPVLRCDLMASVAQYV